MSKTSPKPALFDAAICSAGRRDAFRKLDPATAGAQSGDLRHRSRRRARDVCSVCATCAGGDGNAWFSGQIAAWLWFTVLFANFAEAIAEGRGKAQADSSAANAQPTRSPSA